MTQAQILITIFGTFFVATVYLFLLIRYWTIRIYVGKDMNGLTLYVGDTVQNAGHSSSTSLRDAVGIIICKRSASDHSQIVVEQYYESLKENKVYDWEINEVILKKRKGLLCRY